LRLELTEKLIIGFLLVSALSLSLPPVFAWLGLAGWGALGVALFASACLGWFFARQFTRNVRALRRYTDRIAKGDLTADVDLEGGRRFPDETVDLARSVDGMLQNLRELVKHIQRAAGQVAEASRELSLSSQGVKTTNQEIAATMEAVAEGVVRQQENVQNAVARSHDISDAIGCTAASAREASEVAVDSNHRATAGVDLSRLSIQKMQRLFEKVEEAGRLVVEFEKKIRFVHRITEMITSVADKTHLLSLNASIEAARAGDAGRGFSAVAEEIRKLAESAGEQAEQIEELIRQLEDQSKGISHVVQGMGQEVRAGREDLDSVSLSLEQIKTGIHEVSQRSQAIVAQADLQVEGAHEVVGDVESMSTVAGENAKASDEMRGVLEVQTEGLEELVSQAAKLFDMSGQLGEVARRFRTR